MAGNILVIKLSALGDFILALGAMEAIRKHHANDRITLMTTQPFVDMAARSKMFDDIIVGAKPKWFELGAWAGLIKKLRAPNFTRVYDLQFNDRTKILYHLMGKPDWSGVIQGSPLFYPNPDWRNMHAYDRHAEVLKVAGINASDYPALEWFDADISHFNIKKPYVLIVPGSAPTRPDKRWSAMKYAGLAGKLERDGYNVALLGTRDDSDATAAIKKAMPGVIDLTARTSLYEIAGLARQASGAIGNDTGPMHIAAMCGCPCVSLFSAASDPHQSAPRGADKITVIQSDDMNDISVADVMAAFEPRAVS